MTGTPSPQTTGREFRWISAEGLAYSVWFVCLGFVLGVQL